MSASSLHGNRRAHGPVLPWASPLRAYNQVMADAASRGWGKGWPRPRFDDMVRVEAGGIRVTVHRAIAPLVGHLLNETVTRGYPLRPDWCWGYACRAIAGTSTASNHSWGLALDLQAPKNPMGPQLVTDMPSWMPLLWSRWGFRWGGSYSGRKDAMHYEFMGTPEDAGNLIADLPTEGIEEEGPMAFVAPRPQGGYIVVQPDGGVYTSQGTPFFGSVPGITPPVKLTGDVVGAAWTLSGKGYWLVDRTGAVYAFGDAPYLGGFNAEPEIVRGKRYAVGIRAFPDHGYEVVTADPSGDASAFDGYAYRP